MEEKVSLYWCFGEKCHEKLSLISVKSDIRLATRERCGDKSSVEETS